jgi:hypothetical protein
MSLTLKRLAVLTMSALTLAFAVVPASYAGEDGCDDDNCGRSSGGGGGGGSDTGSASGGAQTGFGGMASTATDGSPTLTIALAAGGMLVLTGAGLVSRRRETVSLDA